METSNSMMDCDKLFVADFLLLDKMIADKKRGELDAIKHMANGVKF